MSNDLFVDTSGWSAYFDQADPHRPAVMEVISQALQRHQTLVTSNYVILELVSLMTSRRIRIPHAQMVAAINLILSEPLVRMEHIDAATHLEAWQLVASRLDKEWSLVDASSFILKRSASLARPISLSAPRYIQHASQTRWPQGGLLGSHSRLETSPYISSQMRTMSSQTFLTSSARPTLANACICPSCNPTIRASVLAA